MNVIWRSGRVVEQSGNKYEGEVFRAVLDPILAESMENVDVFNGQTSVWTVRGINYASGEKNLINSSRLYQA